MLRSVSSTCGIRVQLFLFHSTSLSLSFSISVSHSLSLSLSLSLLVMQNLLTKSNNACQKLVEECVKYGTRVQLFLFQSGYSDMATVSSFASTTSRKVHYLPHYQVGRICAAKMHIVKKKV